MNNNILTEELIKIMINHTDDFIAATEVACRIITPDGKELYNKKPFSPDGCDFCRFLKSKKQQLSCCKDIDSMSPDSESHNDSESHIVNPYYEVHDSVSLDMECLSVHTYGSAQAERFGGKYIYFCDLGFAHCASPVIIDGKVIASIIAGPMLIIDISEFLTNELELKNNISETLEKELQEILRKIPYISAERSNHLSNLLFYTACHISDIDYMRFLDSEAVMTRQNAISDQIVKLKSEGGESYPIYKENELLVSISQGDKKTAQRLLNELLGYIFFSTGGNLVIIKTRVMELIIQLSRAAIRGGANLEQVFDMNNSCMREIEFIKNIDDISSWLSGVMINFTKLVFKYTEIKHIDVIHKVIHYIDNNYAGRITLDDVAREVFLSPTYLSKIFKTEMKCNYNTYLNKIRIEKSKILLLNNNISLIEISSKVGFDDQSYFSKVFKKVTGITPGKFRQLRGHIKLENELNLN